MAKKRRNCNELAYQLGHHYDVDEGVSPADLVTTDLSSLSSVLS